MRGTEQRAERVQGIDGCRDDAWTMDNKKKKEKKEKRGRGGGRRELRRRRRRRREPLRKEMGLGVG